MCRTIIVNRINTLNVSLSIFKSMSITDIEKNYNKINLWILVAITLIGLIMSQILLQQTLITPLIISAIFFIITNKIYGKLWKYFATNSPMALGKFYLVGSMLRMFLAVIITFIGILVFRGDNEKILTYVFVFAFYYISIMFFDSVYFFRIEKNNKINNKTI